MNNHPVKIKSDSYKKRKLLNLYSKAIPLENGCWEWISAKDKNGYGITSISPPRKNVRAHRLMYILTKGDIPEGYLVCHNCPTGDNPSCINPDHLFLGTAKDNSKDRDKKGRGRTQDQRGEKNHMATLNEEKVLEIRKLYNEGVRECDLVRKFGIRQATISKVLLRKRWKHI